MNKNIEKYTESLKTIFETIESPLCVINTQGYMLYSNPAFASEVQAKLKLPFTQYIQSNQGITPEWLQQQIQEGKKTFERTMPTNEGSGKRYQVKCTFQQATQNQPVLLMFFNDITEVITSREDINRHNLVFLEILDHIPDIIYVKDKDGKYLLANKSTVSLLGAKSSESVIGKSNFDFLPTQLATKLKTDEQEIIRSGYSIINVEEEYIGPDNTEVWLSTTKVPLINNNEITGLIGISRNITNEKKEKEAIKNAKKQAEIADQLKSAFLANMSHELRTPLNGILGFAQFLRQANITDEKRTKYLDIIFFNGKHLLTLINNVIDIAKIDAGEIFITHTEFSLNTTFDGLYNNYKNQLVNKEKFEIEIHLEKNLPDDNCTIYTDQNRLVQIIDNLVNNAIKFTNKGQITFGYKPYNPSHLVFYITDTGIGIPKEKQDIIFNKFRQADDSLTRKHGGTGLGLSIVKGLVEILGGEIWFESIYNAGSTFYFTLPFTKENYKKPDEAGTLSEQWKHKKLLVVEDDLMSYRFMETLFKKQYVNVDHAPDGPTALDLFNKNRYDAILMDIKLPGMNGLTVTRKIREKNTVIPIIALTAFAYDNDQEDSINAGCNYYITKPVDKKILFNILNKLIN